MSEYLIDSRSPICNLFATVEMSEDAYYFYIMEGGELDVPKMRHILWLCNRKPAPEELDLEAMKERPPMMPACHVGHDPAGIELDPEDLRIVWHPEGATAALFYREELLAVIPPYVGKYDFPGFSRYARGQHRYAWDFPSDTALLEERVREGERLWASLANEKFWEGFEGAFQRSYGAFIDGTPKHYLHLDDGTQPLRRRLLIAEKQGVVYDLTIGMSQPEIPGAQRVVGPDAEFRKFCRMELGFAAVAAHEPAAVQLMPMVMDDLSRLPWEEIDFLCHGHTIDFRSIRGFTALLLVNPAFVPGMECPAMPQLAGASIPLCWLVPVTEREVAFLREKGIEKLLRKAWMPEKVHIFDMQPKFLS